jgi:hypothetical protein
MSIIQHDFGKEKREIARRFRRLLNLDDFHDPNVLANPVPYLERASKRIYQLEKTLFEAAQAARAVSGQPGTPEMIQVEKAEYERLLHCRAIIEQMLADSALAKDA